MSRQLVEREHFKTWGDEKTTDHNSTRIIFEKTDTITLRIPEWSVCGVGLNRPMKNIWMVMVKKKI